MGFASGYFFLSSGLFLCCFPFRALPCSSVVEKQFYHGFFTESHGTKKQMPSASIDCFWAVFVFSDPPWLSVVEKQFYHGFFTEFHGGKEAGAF